MKTYTLNGTQVFLARTSDIEANPLKTCDEIGAFNLENYNGCETLLTLDDAECGTYSEGEPIMLAECTSLGNDQHTTEAFYTVEWADADTIQRQLVTRTTKYHDWTSERTRMEDAISSKNDGEYLTEEEAQQLREEWKATVSSYHPEQCPSAPDVPTFEALVDSAGSRIAEDLEVMCDHQGYKYNRGIREAIYNAMLHNGITATQISEATGVANSSISRLINGKEGVSVDKLEAILSYLHIRLVF